MNILITGTAGFIGSALAKKLCENGLKVIGIDNHNDYYDTNLKLSRVKLLLSHNNYKHYECDIANKIEMSKIFLEEKPNIVFNLAAQAGVRYSIEYPQSYIDSNISGFQNILDLSKETKVSHVIYASSSSVYGLGNSLPYSVKDRVDRPVSIYAVSKKTNELMAHVAGLIWQHGFLQRQFLVMKYLMFLIMENIQETSLI